MPEVTVAAVPASNARLGFAADLVEGDREPRTGVTSACGTEHEQRSSERVDGAVAAFHRCRVRRSVS